jgi:hypothetical protein
MKSKYNYICALFILFCIHTATAKESWECDSIAVPERYQSSPSQEGGPNVKITQTEKIIFSYGEGTNAETSIGLCNSASYSEDFGLGYISGPFMKSAVISYQINADLSKQQPRWRIRFFRDLSKPTRGDYAVGEWIYLVNCKKITPPTDNICRQS